MAILILEPDVDGRARVSIEHSGARHAEVGRLLGSVGHDIDMPLLENARPEEDPLPCREPVEETTAVSRHFSAQIHALYRQLADYQARSAAELAELKLAPIDTENGIVVKMTVGCQSFTSYPHCQHLIYHARRLTLHDLNPETLPTLPFVRKLRIAQGSGPRREFHFSRVRPVSLRVPLECLVHLPSVAEIDCPWLWEWLPVPAAGRPMRHFTRVWEGPWRDARHEFGAAMEKQEELLGLRIPTSLTKARLWFWQPRLALENNQALAMADLVAPAERDPLSVGVCILAAQLQELNLRAFITEHLFPAPEAPQWSRMRRLTIEFHPLRPDGSWYFVGPRGEDPYPEGFAISEDHYPPLQTTAEDEDVDEQWDEDPQGGEEVEFFPDVFRTEPVNERIGPLLSGFATAVKNMGALEDAELFASLAWHPSETRANEYGDDMVPNNRGNGVYRWGVGYVASNSGGNGRERHALVQWQVGDWRPSQGVLDLFESLGQQEWLDFESCSRTN
ncbi:uncharacterized protein B0H64DRAFT_388502 [Chaetomium fimeti]|uniref:Uncharacterized protein n=1 Tax=Chaetomium fimeti TaxID=1854472 RepID=A0AAE0HMS6_9PEZI|nr:hypothetical protein B0H64DRAFT_388502 [Chaetomium fimeti]